MKRFFLIFLVFLCWSEHLLFAQATTPKYSNEFLAIGVGARSFAMSQSVISNISDVTASYWNPAGLLLIKEKYQISLMHSAYFGGVANYDFAGFTTSIDSVSRLGVSIIRFGVDDIPDTRFLYDANGSINYDNIRFFSAADYAFLFSYARKINLFRGLNFGANFKVIHRTVGSFANAWGFGIDVGLQKTLHHWQLGIMFRDITGTFNAWSHNSALLEDVYNQTGNVIPETSVEITLPKIQAGISRYFRLTDKVGMLTALEFEFTFDGKRNTLLKSSFTSVDPRIGLEIDYSKVAFLRFGAGQIQQVKQFDGSNKYTWQPNFGLGARMKYFTVDYALTDIGNQSEALYSHVFSVTASFDQLNLTSTKK